MFMKIGDITGKLGVSHRSLHYWEDMGIISSIRGENGYRYYDEKDQQRIRQILILRKLRLPLKQIVMVLESDNAADIINTLQQNLNEVEDEITALSTIRAILDAFITRLNDKIMIDLKVDLLDDSTILEIADSLAMKKAPVNEEKASANLVKAGTDLDRAEEHLLKRTDQHIRIIYLPPSAVASALGVGNEAEHESDVLMSQFIQDADVFKRHPGVRLYGFNTPLFNESGGFIQHQYEVWATIPSDLDVHAPLTKKHFAGGLYAAYTSKPINFEEWKPFGEWLSRHEDFEYDPSRSYRSDTAKNHQVRCSGWGCLEEHFNSYNLYGLKGSRHILSHIDFLLPIKEKIRV